MKVHGRFEGQRVFLTTDRDGEVLELVSARGKKLIASERLEGADLSLSGYSLRWDGREILLYAGETERAALLVRASKHRPHPPLVETPTEQLRPPVAHSIEQSKASVARQLGRSIPTHRGAWLWGGAVFLVALIVAIVAIVISLKPGHKLSGRFPGDRPELLRQVADKCGVGADTLYFIEYLAPTDLPTNRDGTLQPGYTKFSTVTHNFYVDDDGVVDCGIGWDPSAATPNGDALTLLRCADKVAYWIEQIGIAGPGAGATSVLNQLSTSESDQRIIDATVAIINQYPSIVAAGTADPTVLHDSWARDACLDQGLSDT